MNQCTQFALDLGRHSRHQPTAYLTKLRQGDKGAAYAYRALLELGAPARHMGEGDDAYVARALKDGPWRRVRHPGNLAYTWSLPAVRRPGTPAQLFLEGLV